MSVTLFHCSHCSIYHNYGAIVRLRIWAVLNPRRGMLRVADDISLPEGHSIPLDDIVESRCPECDGPTELVVLDECPHQWEGWRIDRWGKAYSACRFCGETRKGETRYVTEFSE